MMLRGEQTQLSYRTEVRTYGRTKKVVEVTKHLKLFTPGELAADPGGRELPARVPAPAGPAPGPGPPQTSAYNTGHRPPVYHSLWRRWAGLTRHHHHQWIQHVVTSNVSSMFWLPLLLIVLVILETDNNGILIAWLTACVFLFTSIYFSTSSSIFLYCISLLYVFLIRCGFSWLDSYIQWHLPILWFQSPFTNHLLILILDIFDKKIHENLWNQ